MNDNLIKHESEIELAGVKSPCFILEDGKRILPKQGIQNVLKIPEEVELESYLTLINRNADHFQSISCYKGNQQIDGYEASKLIDMCHGLLDIRKNLELSKRQETVVDRGEMLINSFTKTKIISLIDKATNYQYEKEQAELEIILKTFASKEILEWQKTFQLDFYKQIFRLWNIPFTAENISKKPRFITWLTNELIYKNIPKSSLNPLDKETLKKVFYSVEALASISKDWNKFTKLMKEKYHPHRDLPFIDLEAMDSDYQETEFDKMLKTLLSTPPIRRKKKDE